ncbi:hypothetical protein AciX9_1301 [Granulicella tundricola MP5ACTX9]|uniref:Glycosyltransferase RgtA/B/C/D-like domain-containing protein n=2 Tax=Granulicella TaxID=940557 RepID=E8X599_GRATM|nr:hypothetical protein AciX9_1301 [Granulicella tundricola MP5ACTX9]
MRAGAALGAVSAFFERHAWLAAVLLVLVYLPAAFDASRHAPMWHDELFTYYIAQAPTLQQMWFDLRTLDLNPPLVYLLSRWSFALFGVNTLAVRLPEIAGFLVWMLCTFRFVQRRMGVMFGVFAAMLLLESDLFQFAVVARPYTLMLGFVALAMVGYQEATDGRRRLGLGLLLAGCVGMLLSHIFALLAMAGLILAELWSRRQRGKTDWAVLAALVTPLAVTAIYVPMLRNHGQAIFPAAFQPDGEAIFNFYIASVNRELVALALTALAVLVVLGVRHLRGGPQERGAAWFFTGAEWLTVIWMMTAPLLLILDLMASHGAFFPRYGAIATLGVVILTTALLGRWTISGGRLDERVGLLGAGIVLLMSGLWLVVPQQIAAGELIPTVANSEPRVKPCEACRITAAMDASLPLVDASGLTFMEMNHHENAQMLDRLYYLTDKAGSTQFAHANIFEQMQSVAERFHLRGHVAGYGDFVREHPRFFVLGRYDYPEDWLLRKLTADGAEIRVVARTSDSYRDTELYEVTVKPGRAHSGQ